MTAKTEDVFQARGPIRLAKTEGCTIWQFRNETGAVTLLLHVPAHQPFCGGDRDEGCYRKLVPGSPWLPMWEKSCFSACPQASPTAWRTRFWRAFRLRLADRFLHAPLGDVEGHTIGEIKNMMVDKIESIEPPLAYMIPDGAGHIVLPIVSIAAEGIYL